jgi:hypothetical protein
MSGAVLSTDSSLSSSGYEDGLGRRLLVIERQTGEMLEHLVLRPELCAFEQVLDARISALAALEDERFARPRGLERDEDGRLLVVSEYVPGRRLIEVLDAAVEAGIAPGIDAALGLLLELLPALANLHGLAKFAHGALAAGRVLFTPGGQLVILDAIYAAPLERLQFTRQRLWTEFDIAAPASAGLVRLDPAADLTQAGMIAAAFVVGRPLKRTDYPGGLDALRGEILEVAQIRGSTMFANGVQRFFDRVLPIAGRKPYTSADDAVLDLRQLVRRELGIDACRTALVDFLQQVDVAEVERATNEAAMLDALQEERRRERERAEAARRETERLETERREHERLDKERAEAARRHAERLATERKEKERKEKERAEQERIKRERAEAERKERERLDAERKEKERREKEHLERERRERERVEAARREAERLAAEQSERERLEAERLEQERLERERLEQERIARELAEAARREAERLEAEQREQERLEQERLERERLEQERREQERIAREQAEAARREAERLEAEQRERERLEAERLERERLELERRQRELLEQQRLERERVEAAKREAERLAAEQRERERLEAERREQERLERQRLEQERIECERAEAARREAERLEAERREQERREAERIERERLEKERLERLRAERERVEAAQREAERLEQEHRERLRLEAERYKQAERQKKEEQARLEKERHRKLEAERLEKERRQKIEQERIERERADAARREAAEREARGEAARLEKARAEARAEAARREAVEREAQAEAERVEKARVEAERAKPQGAQETHPSAGGKRRKREKSARARKDRLRSSDTPASPPAAPAVQPSNSSWLVAPDRAAAFEPPVPVQPAAPANVPAPPFPTPPRQYPVYVPPGSAAAASPSPSWTMTPPQSVPVPPPPAPRALPPPITEVPGFRTSPGLQPAGAPIRLKNDAGAPRHSGPGPRVETRRAQEPPPRDLFEPVDTSGVGNPFPWKFVGAAAAALLILGGGIFYLMDRKSEPSPTKVNVSAPAHPAEPAPPPTTGQIVVATQPDGLRVLLDGKPTGESPVTLEGVPPGRHVVTLISATGAVKRTVRVEAGKSVSLDVPIFSGFVAVSSPILVDVSENGRSLGTSENQIMLTPGHHELRFSNKDLEFTDRQGVDIEPGEVRRVELDPRGTININAQPWAEVWIDGQKAGETPLANLPIPLGVREIVFKHPQFGERKVSVTITAGTPAAVSMDFTKQ